MRKLVKYILQIFALLFALLLAGAYLSRFINPVNFWALSFLGLIFPIILTASIILLIILIITKNKAAFLILGFILIGWVPIKESIKLFKQDQAREGSFPVSVMSYNVRVFDNFNWTGQENSGQKLLDFVAERKPDIICFQEFMAKNTESANLQSIKQKLGFTPFNHVKYIYKGRKNKVGLAIFSKYPIINASSRDLSEKEQLFIFADIKIQQDTIRVFNSRFESNRLSQKQKNLIDSLITTGSKEIKHEYLGIIKNLKSAYIIRAKQAELIQEEMSKSPYPIIVAGDFNDTPVSYSYHKITKGLKDAFVTSGKGMGPSYREFIFPLRIDYLLHDPSISSSGFTTHDVRFSDHRPIEANFWINSSKRK